jgi:hypothetical protein
MSNNSIHISSKSLIWITGFILFIVLLIFLFDKIDNLKKYNQFRSLKENLLTSEYPARFEKMAKNFSADDTSGIKLIQQNLSFLEKDIPGINYSEFYIKDSNYYYKINNENYYYNFLEKIQYLPQSIRTYIDYIDSTDHLNVDSLFSFTKNNSNLDLMIKVGSGYLFVRHIRK